MIIDCGDMKSLTNKWFNSLAPGMRVMCFGRSVDGAWYQNQGGIYEVVEVKKIEYDIRTVLCRTFDINEPDDHRIVEWHPMQCWPVES